MGDQLSLATVATSAMPQVFAFLFGRLGAVLDRRSGNDTATSTEPATCPVLVGPEAPLLIHGEELTEQRIRRLEAVARELAVYHRNPALIRHDDEHLLQAMSELRDDLEAVYGQPLSFMGEQRSAPGVRVRQLLDEVEADGVARAVKVGRVTAAASADIEQRTKVVRQGGEVTALEIDGTLG
ncbi:hypothetical protein ACFZAR_32400 [Streptomyces sp. NPDC008222]|uniref:hypothetical protein n=1 Tax=Streptomyces sp. NPDC008222 TaxID=3364820 RepID=UPI0036EFA2BE